MQKWILFTLVLLTLASSTICVSRLFVDELTGYTTELVTADDVRTDLMIVDTQSVNGSLTASSTENHSVDTPGSIAVSTSNTNLQIGNNLTAVSYGNNIRFEGETVALGAGSGDFVNQAVSTSIYAQETNLNGKNFGVNGEHVSLRSAGEIYFSSVLDLNIDADDKLQIFGSEVSLSASGSTKINSEYSNVLFNTGDSFSISGSAYFAAYGESGVKISSEQNELSIDGDGTAYVAADNIQLNGISQAGIFATAGDITLNSINLNVDSDRTIVGSGSALFETSDSADLSVITFGVIQSTSDSVSITTSALEFTSADQVKFTAAMNYNSASQNVTITSDDTKTHSYGDTIVDSFGSTISMAGNVDMESVDGDFLVTATDSIDVSSFNTAMNGIQSFALEATNFQVQSTDFIDLASDGDMNITTNTAAFTTQQFEIFAREVAQFATTNTQTFQSTVYPLEVVSTSDILINPATGSYQNSANSIEYNALTQMKIAPVDELRFSSTTSTLVHASENVLYESGQDIDLEADQFFLDTVYTNVRADEVNINSYSVLLSTQDIGRFSIANAGSLSFTSTTGEVVFQSYGNIGFSSTGSGSIDTPYIQLYSRDTNFNLDFQQYGAENFVFTAPSIEGLIQTSISASQATFTGATSFTAPISRGNGVSIYSGQSVYYYDNAFISGGTTEIDSSSNYFYGTQLSISSANQKDVSVSSQNTTSFTTGVFSISFSGEINFDSTNYTATSSGDTGYSFSGSSKTNIDDILTIQATGELSAISSTYGSEINFIADNGNINTIGGSLTGVLSEGLFITATRTDNQFSSGNGISINVAQDLNINGDTSIESTASSIEFTAADSMHTLFHLISLELSTSMTVTADLGLLLQSTNSLNLNTNTSVVITSNSGVSAVGGNVALTGVSNLTLSNAGDITIGSNLPVISALNYHDVTISVESDVTGTVGGALSILASGNEEYFDEGIDVSLGGFAQYGAGDFYVNGNNGINVNTQDSSTVLATNFIYFATENGNIDVTGNGLNGAALLFQTLTDGTIYPAIGFVSKDAGLLMQSRDDISFTATGQIESSCVEGSKISTTYQSSPIEMTAGDSITSTYGGDLTETVGDAQNIESDFIINANRSVEFRATAGDFLVHSVAQDASNSFGINFNANNLVTTDTNTYYEISVTNDIELYPSGTTSFYGVDANFNAGGAYTFGSTKGSIFSELGDLTITSARDYNVTAGGVDGDVILRYSGQSDLTATANYNVRSNTSNAISANALTAVAARNVKFNTYSKESGIYGGANNTLFESSDSTGTTGVNITGNALTIASSTLTEFYTDFFNIGQNNAEFNPQINGEVSYWQVISLGGGISISAINDDIIQISEQQMTLDARSNIFIKAGGDLDFENTWDTLLPGEGDISIITDNGQISVQAANYIDYHVRDLGTISITGLAEFISTGTSTSTPSTSGIIFKGTNGDISFNAGTTFSETVTTTTAINVGDGGYSATTQTGYLSLNASSGYVQLRSDHQISSASNGGSTGILTTSNNARAEFATEGNSSPISFVATDVNIAASVDQLNIQADGAYFAYVTGDVVISTGANNNGQFNLDASSDTTIRSISSSVTLSTQRDFSIDAYGSESVFDITTAGSLGISADHDATFSTEPGQGGSIRMNLDENGLYTMSASYNLEITSDGDFKVDTNGTFFMWTLARFETAVNGYSEYYSNKSIAIESTDSAQEADIVFNSNDGDIKIHSVGSSDFFAGSNGYGNISFTLDGNAYIVARGNDSGITSSTLLVESLLGESTYNSKLGDLTAESYEHLTFLAFGASEDTGYASFVSRAPSGDGIVVQTTHPGADIYFTGVSTIQAAFDISYIANGNTEESGYIQVINDWSGGKGDSGPSGDINTLPNYPAVTFDSGTETEVRSETGDIDVNYGRRLLLRGGSVSGLSSGGISVVNRGQNRLIESETFSGNIFLSTILPSIAIQDFTDCTFRTNNLGEGEIRIVAESASVGFENFILLMRTHVDQLYVQASASVIMKAQYLQDSTIHPGIIVSSEDYLSVNSFDEGIKEYGRLIRYGVLNADGLLQFASHADANSYANLESVGDTNFNADFFAVYTVNNIDFTADNNQDWSANDNFKISAAKDLTFNYKSDLSISSPITHFITSTNSLYYNYNNYQQYYDGYTQKINFNGRHSTDGYAGNNNVQFSHTSNNPAPTVIFSNNLYIRYQQNEYNPNYGNYYEHQFPQRTITRGGACEHERTFGFINSQGTLNFCVCLDSVWLCNEGTYSGGLIDYIEPYQNGGGSAP